MILVNIHFYFPFVIVYLFKNLQKLFLVRTGITRMYFMHSLVKLVNNV
jgi:hypothetical protein